MHKFLPEVPKTFGEINDVLYHVSCEVSHMWKSSKHTVFVYVFALLGLLCFKGATATWGGGQEGGREGAGM